MSHIDFENFKRRYPALAPAWDALAHWRSEHPDRQYFDVREIVAPNRGITADIILQSVEVLLESGCVRQVYKVVHPHHNVVIGGEYDSPLKVPDRVRGRFDEWVETAEAEVIPLLREV